MKVLWITNILFPEATSILNGDKDFKASGGWMLGSANQLICRDNIELYVATVSPLVKELKRIEGANIVYYIIPQMRVKRNAYHRFWQKINNEICPDIVHIHGTDAYLSCVYTEA